jgi:DNA-binding GntR family transcriptional regulator
METQPYRLEINRESPIPAYYQIELDLKNRITRGEWSIHQSLPSEAELAAQYEVSRITLRQALSELEKERIIKKYRGKAAVINEMPAPFIHDFSYTLISREQITKDGYAKNTITAKILRLERIPSPLQEINEGLKIPPQAPVVYMERLFLLDGEPIAIGKSWLPDSLVPGFVEQGLIENSLSNTLAQRYHISAGKVEDYLDVIRSTQPEYELLESGPDTPLILVKGISYLADGSPLEYSRTVWLGNKVRFRFTLHLAE